MQHRMSLVAATAVLSLVAATAPAMAQHSHGGDHQMMGSGHEESATGHSHEMATVHGGQVTMTPNHHFEALFTPGQARVYVYDAKQMPVADLKKLGATMTLMMKDGKSEMMELKYMDPDPKAGRTQGYFFADRDFSGMKDGDMKATIKVTGLGRDPVEFRTSMMMGEAMSYACPMNDSPAAEDPGHCPKCGMEMKAMHAEGMDHHDEDSKSGHDH